MVGREVELKGVPDKSVLFTLKGKLKLFDLLGVRTENQFGQKIEQLQLEDKLDDELFFQMYEIGINWDITKPVIPYEKIPDILEEFCQVNGFGTQEIRDTLIDALCNSGILNKAIILANRKLRENFDESKVEELVKTRIEQLNRGSDTGEPGQTSTLTK